MTNTEVYRRNYTGRRLQPAHSKVIVTPETRIIAYIRSVDHIHSLAEQTDTAYRHTLVASTIDVGKTYYYIMIVRN